MSTRGRCFGCVLAFAFSVGCQHFTQEPLDATQSAEILLQRSLNDPGLREFVESVKGGAPGWPLASWTLDDLTLAALYFQPALEVWRAQWRLAQTAEVTAAGRRNPVLTVAPGFSANAPAGASPWFPLASVDIPLETAGKRDLRRKRAGELALSAQLAMHSAAWQARTRLRVALIDYEFSQRRSQFLEQQLALESQLVQIQEQRLAAGAASPFDLNLVRSARLRLEADLTDATLKRNMARAQLAEAIGVPTAALKDVRIEPLAASTPQHLNELRSVAARERALQTRSDLRALLAEYAAAETSLRLEIARQYPDVHLNPGYQFDQGEHKWSLGLSVELPLLNQNQGPIAEAEAKRRETAARFLARQAEILALIDQAQSEIEILEQQQVRARELRELQSHQRRATEAAFQAGNADRFELTSAQFESVLAELNALDLQAREMTSIARLEDALESEPALSAALNKPGQHTIARGNR